MPDEGLMQRFEAIIQAVQEPTVRRYLEEAYRCFAAKAYNGAVVMTWNAASCYLRQVIEAIGVALFEHNYRILHGQNPPGELWRINDSLFIQTCQRMGILQEIVDTLNEPRELRNQCAHPSGHFASVDDAIEFVESFRSAITRRTTDERLADRAIVREFIKVADEESSRAIAEWIDDDLCAQLAHDGFTMYLRDEEIEDSSGLVGLWQSLWPRIDEQQKKHLWNRLEQAVQTVLQEEEGAGHHTPEDLVRLIVWPPPDEANENRDRIGELFVEWFEGLAESGGFRAVDMDLAREVRQYLPTTLRERLQAVLREMTRRYVE
jgi:hypothetical protein